MSRNPDSRARFDREARAIAALNHPHICALHDIGQQDGLDFLVMEYLDGETLADRLAKGRLPFREALEYGVQILDALDKAHGHGIVHRDLKPANIVVTRQGVKLLDFGLARLAPVGLVSGVAHGAASVVEGVTRNAPLTERGTILGTLQYMAPEQLEGKEVDARTDIFAFGVVFHEMLTGTRAFEGSSQASLIAAILDHDPTPLRLSQSLTPAALERAVAKCLGKSPETRWQSARDLRDELKWITTAGADAGADSPVASRAGRERLAWTLCGVATLAALLVAGVAILQFRANQVDPPSEMRLDVVTPPAPTAGFASGSPALSPDGRYLAFVAQNANQQQIWIRQLNSTAVQPLAGTEEAQLPFWSPDSRSIGFFAGGILKRIDVAGGAPQVLAELSSVPRGGTWNADDVIVFATGGSPLNRVPAIGGEIQAITKLDPPRETDNFFPSFLPDGRHLLYQIFGTREVAGIYLASLDGSNRQRLVADAGRPVYAAQGYLLFVRGAVGGPNAAGMLFGQRFSTDGKELGRARLIARDVDRATVSRAGLLAYRTAPAARQQQLTWFDRAGKILGAVGPPFASVIGTVELSPDGKQVAISRIVDGNEDVYLLNIADSAMTRLTVDAARDDRPLWSPDGRRILFNSDRSPAGLYEKPSSGTESERLVLENPSILGSSTWSPDGAVLLYRQGNDFWKLFISRHEKPVAWTKSPFDEANAQFSPDGKWLAYTSNESGKYEIFVQAFQGSGKWTVSTSGGVEPRWRADGKELFYIGSDSGLRAVPIAPSADGRGLTVGTPSLLFRAPVYSGFTSNARIQYVVTADGQRFLINKATEGSTATPITVVSNWTAALSR